ncbi:unnamed protein product, partial [marine sediment metagenome]
MDIFFTTSDGCSLSGGFMGEDRFTVIRNTKSDINVG